MQTKKQRILVVDDDPMIRSVIRKLLEPEGYEVVEAYDGAEALRVLSRESCNFDLVILDYRMPGMTGTVTAMFVRDHCPDVPMLFMSGADIDSDLVDVGALLPKPWTRDDLLDAVRRRIRG